ncbi:MAG: DUF2470 domain-containing protein [Actinomycetota bacterium]|nr:DUF2470 domain-containing protein [Actinomycetota bacterium]
MPPHRTTVALEGDDEGILVIRVPRGSLAAAQLLVRPLATVQVAPSGCEMLTLQGAGHRLPPSADGMLRYRVEVAAVRLGERTRSAVPVEEFWAARPDPLRDDAPAVLRHLSQCHGEALAACLRARGHDVVRAEPRALDCRGMDVVGLGVDGVTLVRLAFPGPVARLQDLPAGLAVPMRCRCRCRCRAAVPRP